MDTKKMRAASHLLPAPGGEVVRECLDEIERLRMALGDVIEPIAAMRRDLKPGYVLNGQMAVQSADNAAYLKDIAKQALRESMGGE